MKEDNQWLPISVDFKSYSDKEKRIRNGSPLATRGKTQFRFYENILTGRNEVSDYYSDDDTTIQLLTKRVVAEKVTCTEKKMVGFNDIKDNAGNILVSFLDH